MNLDDIQYREISTSSLSRGSVFTKNDLQFYADGSSSLNFPFGQLNKDFIKYSVFNVDGTAVTSSLVYADGVVKSYTQSYYDVYNRHVTYAYEQFTTDWVVLGSPTRSLFFDISKEMKSLGLPVGNYTAVIELVRDMVGSRDSIADRLIINTISSNRNEISLIPKYLAGTVSSSLMEDFNNFGLDKFKAKEVAQDLLDALANPEMYSAYYKALANNPSGGESFKFNYGFNTRTVQQAIGTTNFNPRGHGRSGDIDAIAFLTDMYYGVRKGNLRANGQYAINDITGIYDQFKNWLLINYEVGVSFQEIKDYYYSLFRFIADSELNHITNKRSEDYDNTINFLEGIYYNTIFYPKESLVEFSYIKNLTGYFKNFVNFDAGQPISILNKKLVKSTDADFNDQLVLKLERPLDQTIAVGEEVWITNTFGFQPIVQNLYYYTKPTFNTIQLRGPNFSVQVESEGNSTELLSMEQLVEQTGSEYNELLSKLGARASESIDNTDYRYFKNFVNFSSAEMRMSAYNYKKNQIDLLRNNIAELSIKLAENPNDTFYRMEIEEGNSQIDGFEASMDGYEKFLYDNSMWYATHEESASLYDKENGNSLVNNLPQFIVEDATHNADYITFVGMIGHFFDNLSTAVKQLTDKNNYSSSPNQGISTEVVYDMLQSLGWEAEISKDNLPLLLASFSKQDFDPNSDLYNAARTFSEEERNKVIWKRILNTLPYLYKTKGTEAGLSALITCFGIPKNIVKVREYGGIHKTHDLQDSTLYVIDEVKYEPYFSGSGEYFRLNWTGSAQTVEFNFAFDTTKTSEEGKIFRLVNCSGSWLMGAYRERGEDWGRLFFSLDNGSGNTQTIMTEKAPIFDGKTYHAMLRRNNPATGFQLGDATNAVIDPYPIRYDLFVATADNAKITYMASGSHYFSGSHNQHFRSGNYLYMGNYEQSTSSFNLDPEAFFGNIDEIKIWESVVDDTRFINHTLHQNSYDLDTPQQMVRENLFRISFERPVDLYDAGGVTLNNLSFRSDFPTFQARNFTPYYGPVPKLTECGPESASVFPYQFSRKDTRQTVKLPDYGANKFRSNKINYVQQELITNLSSTQRASMQASELSSVDANKLGVFFSPTESHNMEIIKFFGDYPLTDLIGDPSSVYENSYRKFNKFKQIFYDQGFGAVDYQFFMNIVRFYFDKAMLKYIRGMVPARAKLVDGILIEPSILERPKVALKPMTQEVIAQKTGTIDATSTIRVIQAPKITASIDFRDSGKAILEDINHVMFPGVEDTLGFSVFADTNNLTYYAGKYYRVDVANIKRSYQTLNKCALAKPSPNSLNDVDRETNFNGTVKTITTNHGKVSLALLPVVTSYPITMSFSGPNSNDSFYFSGSVDFVPTASNGYYTYQLINSHSISGIITGSIIGRDPRNPQFYSSSAIFSDATILASGLRIDATAAIVPSASMLYTGLFSTSGSVQLFAGNVRYGAGVPPLGTNHFDLARFVGNVGSMDYTSSIFDQFKTNTSPNNSLFSTNGLLYRKEVSTTVLAAGTTLLTGYRPNHYKYTRRQFSHKTINSYDITNQPVKWKRGSQNKKTTIDPSSGLLDNSDPVETKTT